MFSLKTKAVSGCIIVLLLTSILSIALMVRYWVDYGRATESFQELTLFRQALIVDNLISAERGPVNVALGAPSESSAIAQQNLDAFRADVDSQLQRLLAQKIILADKDKKFQLEAAITRLKLSRDRVDEVLGLSYNERSVSRLRATTLEMFAAVDAMRPLIDSISLRITNVDHGLSGVS